MSLSKMLEDYREGLRGLPTYDELVAIASSAPMTQERFNEKMDALDKVNPEPLARLMAATEQCADPIVERNVSLLRQRSTVGVQKYGTTLADNKLPLRVWLNHALEEALDQANYLQAAMAEIDSAAGHQIADATEDAELFGIGYLVDGVNVHPSRVTVLRPASPMQAQEPRKPTDISKRLREYAGNNGYSHNDYADMMRDAADEIELMADNAEALTDAYRALQNTLLVVPDGDFKRKMDDWLSQRLGVIGGETISVPAPVQPVAVPDDMDLQTIRERDYNAEMADKLAEAISKHFGIDIGEHSNMNCPWHEALEAIENATPAMWAALNMNGKAVCVNQDKQACDVERLCIKTPTTIAPLYVGASEPQ